MEGHTFLFLSLFCVESHLTLLGEFSASFEGAFEIVGKSNNISLGFEEKERSFKPYLICAKRVIPRKARLNKERFEFLLRANTEAVVS